ncbi:hypothetical protein [Polyangium sp. 6x1]|uniref:hypothetical protein n=1 Tax=Polyangium sp. 6x1 TaxID=3042689 RepID=UPI00248219E4|nr:hypothetical protein [Polyangium sp. 6x1]MDI1444365.1 hypothetical protein [Polyangium sp. 6x1]
MRRRNVLVLALVTPALAAIGCDKKNTSGEAAAALADFPDKKPSAWIHGAPAPLEEARGKVVLVEAWHPT